MGRITEIPAHQKAHLIQKIKDYAAMHTSGNYAELSRQWVFPDGRVASIIRGHQKVSIYVAHQLAEKLGISLDEALGPKEPPIPGPSMQREIDPVEDVLDVCLYEIQGSVRRLLERLTNLGYMHSGNQGDLWIRGMNGENHEHV